MGKRPDDESTEPFDDVEGKKGGGGVDRGSVDPEDWNVHPLSGRPKVKPEQVETDVGWDGVSV